MKREKKSTKNMVMASLMFIIGIIPIFSLKLYNVSSLEEFKNIFIDNSSAFLWSIMLISYSIYSWITMMRSRGNIKNENYDSYWLSFYLPNKSKINIPLAPVLYLAFIPGVLLLVVTEGFEKIYGVIFILVPVYLLIYDLIYKIKKRKSGGGDVFIDDSKMLLTHYLLRNFLSLIPMSIFVIYLYIEFYNKTNFVINGFIIFITILLVIRFISILFRRFSKYSAAELLAKFTSIFTR